MSTLTMKCGVTGKMTTINCGHPFPIDYPLTFAQENRILKPKIVGSNNSNVMAYIRQGCDSNIVSSVAWLFGSVGTHRAKELISEHTKLNKVIREAKKLL